MRSNRVQLPQGVRDIIGQEAFAKRRAEQAARGMFALCGYEEIETPTFEYASVFDGEVGDLRLENMVHFFDSDGRMLTMRPDFTLPCARVVSALSGSFEAPVRVFYSGNAFGLEHNTGRQRREFSQIGAELMGMSGPVADGEIIMLAHQVLNAIGIEAYLLDIGHVGAFAALYRAANLTLAQAEALRNLLDEKNEWEARALLQSLGVDPELQTQLLALCSLYGDRSVLTRARDILTAPGCAKALDEVEAVCAMLCDCGLQDRITLDLGHLTNMDYYTGTVFRAMAGGVGSPLLSGGRYDGVLAQFGRPMPATGFAMGTARVLEALRTQGGWAALPAIDVLVGAQPGEMGKAFAQAAQLRQQGQKVVTVCCENEDELRILAQQKGAMRTLMITQGGAS